MEDTFAAVLFVVVGVAAVVAVWALASSGGSYRQIGHGGTSIADDRSPAGWTAGVVFDALASAKARHADVVLIDTAGRLQTAKPLMDQLSKIRRVVSALRSGVPPVRSSGRARGSPTSSGDTSYE